MAGLITTAGIARKGGRIGAAISSALVARVGQMVLFHEQHGTSEAAARAKSKHERLGRTILAGAALQAVGDLSRFRYPRAAGAVLMTAAGLQLLAYREPQGAYDDDLALGPHDAGVHEAAGTTDARGD